MRTVKTTAFVWVRVRIQCEGCGKRFNFRRQVSHEVFENNREAAMAGLIEKLQTKSFHPKRCPNCGFLQSWMQPAWRRLFENALFLAGFFLVIGVMFWFGKTVDINSAMTRIMAAIMLVGSSILVFMLFRPLWRKIQQADPNRRWHKVNGPKDPPPRTPEIVPTPPWISWDMIWAGLVAGAVMIYCSSYMTGGWRWGWIAVGILLILWSIRAAIRNLRDKDPELDKPA